MTDTAALDRAALKLRSAGALMREAANILRDAGWEVEAENLWSQTHVAAAVCTHWAQHDGMLAALKAAAEREAKTCASD